jgi:hypothetical protein
VIVIVHVVNLSQGVVVDFLWRFFSFSYLNFFFVLQVFSVFSDCIHEYIAVFFLTLVVYLQVLRT